MNLVINESDVPVNSGVDRIPLDASLVSGAIVVPGPTIVKFVVPGAVNGIFVESIIAGYHADNVGSGFSWFLRTVNGNHSSPP
jgi:hypothetical protein